MEKMNTFSKEYMQARREVNAEVRKTDNAMRRAMNGYASIKTARRPRRSKKFQEPVQES